MRPSHRRGNRDWPRRHRFDEDLTISAVEVLKDIWTQDVGGEEWARPWWAKLAKERHWMSAEAYYDIEPEPTGRMSALASLYEESPLFALLKREPL